MNVVSVALSAVMEMLSIVMVTHSEYSAFAANFDNPAVLLTASFSTASLPFINGFSTYPVRRFALVKG